MIERLMHRRDSNRRRATGAAGDLGAIDKAAQILRQAQPYIRQFAARASHRHGAEAQAGIDRNERPHDLDGSKILLLARGFECVGYCNLVARAPYAGEKAFRAEAGARPVLAPLVARQAFAGKDALRERERSSRYRPRIGVAIAGIALRVLRP